jgi:hypothetical protein
MTGDPTQDPHDRALEGLQDARDESEPGPDYSEQLERYAQKHDAVINAWRDRYDTREEWEASR